MEKNYCSKKTKLTVSERFNGIFCEWCNYGGESLVTALTRELGTFCTQQRRVALLLARVLAGSDENDENDEDDVY